LGRLPAAPWDPGVLAKPPESAT